MHMEILHSIMYEILIKICLLFNNYFHYIFHISSCSRIEGHHSAKKLITCVILTITSYWLNITSGRVFTWIRRNVSIWYKYYVCGCSMTSSISICDRIITHFWIIINIFMSWGCFKDSNKNYSKSNYKYEIHFVHLTVTWVNKLQLLTIELISNLFFIFCERFNSIDNV